MNPSDATRVLVIDAADNVATTLTPLARGTEMAVDRSGTPHNVVLADDIPFGHKFALGPITAGSEVRKYGVVIARATMEISAGAHVHVHNIESNRGRGDRA